MMRCDPDADFAPLFYISGCTSAVQAYPVKSNGGELADGLGRTMSQRCPRHPGTEPTRTVTDAPSWWTWPTSASCSVVGGAWRLRFRASPCRSLRLPDTVALVRGRHGRFSWACRRQAG